MAETTRAMDGSVLRVAMLNQKGGVGKTTTTVNLGHALAQSGRRVCLIDLDPQAHLTLHLGIDADDIDHTVYDLLLDPACEAHHATITARDNLDAILAEVDLAAAETELTEAPDRLVRLRDKFADVQDQYDVILIDCPPQPRPADAQCVESGRSRVRADAGALSRAAGRGQTAGNRGHGVPAGE